MLERRGARNVYVCFTTGNPDGAETDEVVFVHMKRKTLERDTFIGTVVDGLAVFKETADGEGF